MKKLLFWALVLFAAWYAWKHYPEITRQQPRHEAVVQNRSGHPIERLRLSVDGQTFVRDTLKAGDDTKFSFRVSKDGTFDVVWDWGDRLGEGHWNGGRVPSGPIVQRHVLVISGDGGVVYNAEDKTAK